MHLLQLQVLLSHEVAVAEVELMEAVLQEVVVLVVAVMDKHQLVMVLQVQMD